MRRLERETQMETAQNGGRETDRARNHAIDEGHTETEEALGSETVIVLEVVQEGEADNGQEEDANTQRGRKRQRNVDNWKRTNANYTFEYYLTSEGRQIRVCKDLFLKTLDVSEKFARSAGGHTSSELGITPPSKKGRHAPQNKVTESSKDKIQEHINSFPKLESHYSKKDTNKLYLEGSLNLPKCMHCIKRNANRSGRLYQKNKVFIEQCLTMSSILPFTLRRKMHVNTVSGTNV